MRFRIAFVLPERVGSLSKVPAHAIVAENPAVRSAALVESTTARLHASLLRRWQTTAEAASHDSHLITFTINDVGGITR